MGNDLFALLTMSYFFSTSSIVVVRYDCYISFTFYFLILSCLLFVRNNSFIACWLPFFIHYIARPFVDKDSIWTNEILEQFLLWLGWMNSAINPFIYAFYNGDFRIAFYRLTFRACYRNQQNNVFK